MPHVRPIAIILEFSMAAGRLNLMSLLPSSSYRKFIMRRAFFIALGIMAIIIGLECLVIDSASFYSAKQTDASSFFDPSGAPSFNTRVWYPKDWIPWAALSGGAITVLYAFSLPQRFTTPVIG
jgi:hypothetical protein